MIIGSIRGMFVAENYWEWKQLIGGILALSLPVFVYVFSIPWILKNTIRIWLWFGLPLFFVFFIFVLKRGAYHFYLGPVLLFSCFLPVLKRGWQAVFFMLILLMMFVDFGARSQVIKAAVALFISFGYYLIYFRSRKILKIIHWFFYILPAVLLALGISGTFNIFQDLSKNEGIYKEKKVVGGEMIEEDISADTRTFIYKEVIESAIRNDYWILGRTPARGNDSDYFGDFMAEELNTGKYERHKNELCFPNVFTWLGIVGMILYCLIYLKASYLAVYKSRNIFMKLLGVFIAFRFTYGWVEDFNSFSIMNIALWMIIAMGFSDSFRKMTNREFKYWIYKTVRF
ncbi:hypothetical protein [Sphingobacterium micropteri]|nr:hypothetical protein [Sphingobacterium micropteri]